MTAIFWPAYQVSRPRPAVAATDHPRHTATPAPEEPALRVGRLEDYVAQGLLDLRIMLVQAARRGD